MAVAPGARATSTTSAPLRSSAGTSPASLSTLPGKASGRARRVSPVGRMRTTATRVPASRRRRRRAAAAVAAVLAGRLRTSGQTVAVVLTGANIDEDVLNGILAAHPGSIRDTEDGED